MNIDHLINRIIPPADYQHRNGFTNEPIIDKLTNDEKKQVEEALIYKLSKESNTKPDILIVETLAYLKSQKALPILYNLLKANLEDIYRLGIATYIFKIDQDTTMIKVASDAFKNMEEKDANNPYYVHSLISTFYYLAKFKKPDLNILIEKYINSKENLLAHNAKQALYYQHKLTGNYIPNDMAKKEIEEHNSRVLLNKGILPISFWERLKRLFN